MQFFIVFLAIFLILNASSANNCGCKRDPGGNKCSGKVQPGATRLANHIRKKFNLPAQVKTNLYNCPNLGTNNAFYVHREGRAVDFLLGPKLKPAMAEKIFKYAISIACKSGIQEVIYNGRIWLNGGIRPIPGGFPAGQHKDHVHIGLNKCGAQKFGL